MSKLFQKVQEIVGARKPGSITFRVDYETPEGPINPPCYSTSDKKFPKAWASYQKGSDVWYILNSDPATANAMEEAILWAMNEGLIKHPDISINLVKCQTAINLIQVPHRLYDGMLNFTLEDNKPVTQLPWYNKIYMADEATRNRALLYMNPETLLFGGYGGHAELTIDGEKKSLGKPIKMISLVEGFAAGKCDNPDSFNQIGLRRGGGSFMPPLAVTAAGIAVLRGEKPPKEEEEEDEVGTVSEKGSELGLNTVPANLDEAGGKKSNRGSTTVIDPFLQVEFIFTRLNRIVVGKPEENLVARSYLFSLWLLSVYAASNGAGTFWNFRRGCHLKPKTITVSGDLRLDEAVDCYNEAYTQAVKMDLLMTKPLKWKVTDEYDNAVFMSMFKKLNDKKDKKDKK